MAEKISIDARPSEAKCDEISASHRDDFGVTSEDEASPKVERDLNHIEIEASHIDEIFSAASTSVTLTPRDEYGADFSVTLAATFLDDALLNRHIEFK